MTINTEVFGSVLVAHTPEELTDETVPELQEILEEHLEEGIVSVVLQMDRSEAFDSAGLTALVTFQGELRDQGGNMRLCGLNPTSRKIFEITRLDQRFDIFESVIDAVSSYI